MTIIRQSGTFSTHSDRRDFYKAFTPLPLPPKPPIKFDEELSDLMDQANRALGRLDGISALIPNTVLFTSFFIKKEALLSSQIEGTQSTFSELLLFETKEMVKNSDDTQEVANYTYALRHGLSVLNASPESKITLKLLTEMHELLLSNCRGGDKSLGRFRNVQNWTGGDRPSEAKFVFTPPENVMACLEDLEKFLDDLPVKTPVLMKAALVHVQFETIHPFEDGNGRIGRLLIVILLCKQKALTEPILYLSLYFKKNYREYLERLQNVRFNGDWEGWLKFFFQGVLEVSEQAVSTGKQILDLFAQDRKRIESLPQGNTSLRIHEHLQLFPIVSIKKISKELKVSIPSVTTSLKRLEKLRIINEMTGNSRNRLFVYQSYLNLLSEGTTPLER